MRIKDYHKFQHFGKRRPPWIKLYRDILDDYDISLLPDKTFRLLVNLWLLASEDKSGGGNLPDIDTISFRLRLPKQQVVNSLGELTNYVIQDDINMISQCNQDDILETEGEKETKKSKRRYTEAEKKRIRVDANSDLMIRIGDWFGRKPTTLWTLQEAEMLDGLGELNDDELSKMQIFYEAEIPEEKDYRRRTIATMLTNWNGELDKAIEYVRKQRPRGNQI